MSKNYLTGFTLVETLVAISILVLAATGAFAAAQNSISTSTFAKDQIAAFYLAQEGIEHIRNMRDENGIAGRNWLTGFAQGSSDPCYFGRVCMVDTIGNTLTTCSGACPVLRQEAATGFWGYNASWPSTRFRRSVTLTSISADEVSILVTVDWSKGVVNREFRARENILNWQ